MNIAINAILSPVKLINQAKNSNTEAIQGATNFLTFFLPGFYLIVLLLSKIFNIYSSLSWAEVIIFFLFSLLIAIIYRKLTGKLTYYLLGNRLNQVPQVEINNFITTTLVFLPVNLSVLAGFISIIFIFIDPVTSMFIFAGSMLLVLLHFVVILFKLPGNQDKKKNTLSDFAFIFAVIFFVLINPLGYLSYIPIRYELLDLRVTGRTDMNPGLSSRNIVIINKIAGFISRPDYKDLVLVESPVPAADKRLPFEHLKEWMKIDDFNYIRRIVAKTGDSVSLTPELHTIVNNSVIEEPYIKQSVNYLICEIARYCNVDMVKENSYYLLGDNRNSSQDSRIWSAVNIKYLRGKIYAIIWPRKDLKFLN